MKETIYALIISIIVLLTACSTDTTTKTNNSNPSLDLTAYETSAYSGAVNWQKATKKDEKGVIVEEGDIKNNQKTGIWTTYHPKNGMVASVVAYEDGVKHGVALKIGKRGRVTEKMTYIQGRLEGKKLSYENSKLKEEANYKNGKLHGERKIYYGTSGQKIQEEGFFKNGKREGTNKWYNEEGEVTIEYEYVNGEKTTE